MTPNKVGALKRIAEKRPNFLINKRESMPGKVHIFWEGHTILRNLHLTFDYSTQSQK